MIPALNAPAHKFLRDYPCFAHAATANTQSALTPACLLNARAGNPDTPIRARTLRTNAATAGCSSNTPNPHGPAVAAPSITGGSDE
jgi:hypothetical protein